jgi:hypothetical protein
MNKYEIKPQSRTWKQRKKCEILPYTPDILCPRIILGEDSIKKNALGLSVHLLKAHKYQIYNKKIYQ